MAEFANILACNLGGAAAQLTDYTYQTAPIVKEDKGRTGTTVTLSGTGYVNADAGAFGAAVRATVDQFSLSGADVIVSEFSGALLAELLAARCLNGGPHVGVKLLGNLDGTALVKKFEFAATGEQNLGGDDSPPTNSYTLKTTTGPDGMRQVSIDGEIAGKGAMAYYSATVLPAFNAAYPTAKWVPTNSAGINQAGDKASYSIGYVEITAALPAAGGTVVVDGEATTRLERDEQQRLLAHYTYDMLCVGDPQKILDALRPLVRPGIANIIRESSEVTTYKGRRLRAEFIVLTSGSGNDLLDWSQGFGRSKAFPTVTEATYPGIDPFLIRNPKNAARFTQRGRAVGLFKFPKEPEPIFPYLVALPVIVRTHISEWEKETTWEYQFASTDPAMTDYDLTKLRRPDQIGFY